MTPENFVYATVRSYELPEVLEKKVLRIVEDGIEKECLTSPQSQYNYIDKVVSVYQRRWGEGKEVRFDETSFENPRKTKHEVIADETYEPSNLITRFEEEPNYVTVEEAFAQLEDQFDNVSLEFLKRTLQQNGNVMLDISAAGIEGRSAWVLKKLNSLAARYKHKGQIIIPPRPIKDVKFHGELEIEFGQRRYPNGLLAFYLDNLEVYKGMGRTELFNFDEGFYRTLSRAGLLDVVIPENLNSKQPNEKEIMEIYNTFIAFNKNATAAAKCLPWSIPTVRKYGVAFDAIQEVRSVNQGIPIEKVIKIISFGNQRKRIANALRISRKVGHKRETVTKYLKAAGFTLKPGNPGYDQSVTKEAILTYHDCKGNVAEVSRRLKKNYKNIKNHLEKKGLPALGLDQSLPLEDREKIRISHLENGGIYAEVVRDTGFHIDTVTKYCKLMDLPSRRWKQYDDNEVFATFNGCGCKIGKTSQELGIGKRTVKKALIRKGVSFPEKKAPLSLEVAQQAFENSGGNANEAARNGEYSDRTYQRKWKKMGLIQ